MIHDSRRGPDGAARKHPGMTGNPKLPGSPEACVPDRGAPFAGPRGGRIGKAQITRLHGRASGGGARTRPRHPINATAPGAGDPGTAGLPAPGAEFFFAGVPQPPSSGWRQFSRNHLLFRCRAGDRQGDERAARVYSVDGSQSMMKFVNKPCSFRG